MLKKNKNKVMNLNKVMKKKKVGKERRMGKWLNWEKDKVMG